MNSGPGFDSQRLESVSLVLQLTTIENLTAGLTALAGVNISQCHTTARVSEIQYNGYVTVSCIKREILLRKSERDSIERCQRIYKHL